MARPQKEGLMYFPLDVDMDTDDKVILVQAKHGVEGFGILIRLLMEIYRNGYYYPWTEREQLIFSSRINTDINVIIDVVNDALKWGFFHQELYEKYEILTSRGIQKRYLEGTAKRKEVCLIKEFLLVDPPKRNNIVISGINEVFTGNNPVDSGINPQSKVNKSNNIQPPPQQNGSGELVNTFEKEFGRPLSPLEYEEIRNLHNRHGPELTTEALRRAVAAGKLNLRYINGILGSWYKQNLKTIREVQEYERQREEAKTGGTNRAKPAGNIRAAQNRRGLEHYRESFKDW